LVLLVDALLGAVVVAVLLVAAAFWSVLLGVCAGGFTGALALSEDAPAGLVVVVAGAFALFWSVAGVVLLAEGWFDARWSEGVVGAAELVEEPADESDGAALEAWLLVQESEIMFTE